MDIGKFFEFVKNQWLEIWSQTYEHLYLTIISLLIACFLGIMAGIFISQKEKYASSVISMVNVIQTIPSLALLGFMIPLLGIGKIPAITALFLYALLPIVRNTYTGITNVDPAIIEAGSGMGMTENQILFQIKIPIALPVIFAGIRTASVINVGVATLSALIGAGGLGEFIFKGIQLNNSYMILAGAIPASLLALIFDFSLGKLADLKIRTLTKISGWIVVILITLFSLIWYLQLDGKRTEFLGGFPSEFIEREDGLKGLFEKYNFEIDYIEMEIGLMYKALNEKEVDIISGFSTDGRILEYGLSSLKDDRSYFPPYYAAPVIRNEIHQKYPFIKTILSQLHIDDSTMTALNYQVDIEKKTPLDVARNFLEKKNLLNIHSKNKYVGRGVIKVGSKAFTENYILANIFALIIDHQSTLEVEKLLGFGGTKLIIEAMKNDELDIYPEYTGTALLLMLQPEDHVIDSLGYDREKVFDYVSEKSLERFDLKWLNELGLNNTFALMVRDEFADKYKLGSISDLAERSK
ncbi:ABC transporter permease/substrate-binding protein [Mangrovivirga sp. M17]|uniref:ABC transporter permease/substrate-binding protein n=1 Tax=Mangrovivirga halotolerans TaxID=2993936 RepID=A0ABT3RRJ6_9BACT|nr:ABC transporter permease/substrate-binding protein [Mangrovivirga halotolerans]MCX2744226.1 ABC transporter permease/substrate-binding protein [Mangrovivirga halotolerans]